LPVRAEVENTDRALKPQMFASFRIVTGPEGQGIGVPESAVVYDAEQAHVWVVQKDGVLKKREVHIGRRQNGVLEVTEGLAPDERVVTEGPLFMDQAVSGG
jgi:cobalt-zinc-cadmium efflux system membrane fusion protein